MADQKMGFEGSAYYGGTPGVEATTPIPETRDMTETFDADEGDTTVREYDGGGNPLIPVETAAKTKLKWGFDFQTLNVPGNAVIAAMLAASYAGTAIAFRTKDFAAGKGFNGDVTLKHKFTRSLSGEQTIDWTCKPTRAGGRRPEFYV